MAYNHSHHIELQLENDGDDFVHLEFQFAHAFPATYERDDPAASCCYLDSRVIENLGLYPGDQKTIRLYRRSEILVHHSVLGRSEADAALLALGSAPKTRGYRLNKLVLGKENCFGHNGHWTVSRQVAAWERTVDKQRVGCDGVENNKFVLWPARDGVVGQRATVRVGQVELIWSGGYYRDDELAAHNASPCVAPRAGDGFAFAALVDARRRAGALKWELASADETSVFKVLVVDVSARAVLEAIDVVALRRKTNAKLAARAKKARNAAADKAITRETCENVSEKTARRDFRQALPLVLELVVAGGAPVRALGVVACTCRGARETVARVADGRVAKVDFANVWSHKTVSDNDALPKDTDNRSARRPLHYIDSLLSRAEPLQTWRGRVKRGRCYRDATFATLLKKLTRDRALDPMHWGQKLFCAERPEWARAIPHHWPAHRLRNLLGLLRAFAEALPEPLRSHDALIIFADDFVHASPETAALSAADKESESARTARVLRIVAERGGAPTVYRARDAFKRPLAIESEPRALHVAVFALRQARSTGSGGAVSAKPPPQQRKVSEFFARK
ncbi:hypothetical protein JL720_555 [Aureococcus anophagefferens]|nr:hypothetical protein JL720_555 [Aureococcus anophagefferens]